MWLKRFRRKATDLQPAGSHWTENKFERRDWSTAHLPATGFSSGASWLTAQSAGWRVKRSGRGRTPAAVRATSREAASDSGNRMLDAPRSDGILARLNEPLNWHDGKEI